MTLFTQATASAADVLIHEQQGCSRETIAVNLQDAHAFMTAGDYRQSERLFTILLACQKRLLSSNDMQVAVTLSNIGEIKRLQGQYRAAAEFLKEAILLHETAARTSHPAFGATLLSLASVYNDRKQYYASEPLVRRAMEIFETSLGPESREACAALNTLAILYAQLGNPEAAERHLRTALQRRQDSPPDVSTATAHYNLGKVLFEMDRLKESEEYLQKALHLRRELLGPRHPFTRLTLDAYVQVLKRTGKKRQAREIGAAMLQPRP